MLARDHIHSSKLRNKPNKIGWKGSGFLGPFVSYEENDVL
jgi:hypothetical protein